MNKSILVIGATGYVGGKVIDHLLGHNVPCSHIVSKLDCQKKTNKYNALELAYIGTSIR
ncbi:MAG: hypothetical protein O2887_17620 [Bacteroidetes bacterium]|nr:hypothetical protein [Bacteroidota bacterium]MDA1122276.1 hypothetical protein [Bacteroidota bacterium]